MIMVCLIDHRLRVCFPFTMKLVCCFCRGSTEDGSNESDHQESDEGAEVVVEDDDGAEELEELQEQEPGKGGGGVMEIETTLAWLHGVGCDLVHSVYLSLLTMFICD